MAYGNPGYEDMGSEESPRHEASESPAEERKEHQGEEYPLPIGVLAGKEEEFNVGDEVILKITAKHPDQIFVTYAPAKGKEGEGKEAMGEEAAAGAEGGDREMSSMYE